MPLPNSNSFTNVLCLIILNPKNSIPHKIGENDETPHGRELLSVNPVEIFYRMYFLVSKSIFIKFEQNLKCEQKPLSDSDTGILLTMITYQNSRKK